MFAATAPPPGSRPSTADSHVKTQESGRNDKRPQSAGPKYDPTGAVFKRIGSPKTAENEQSLSQASLVVPQARPGADYSDADDYGYENGSFEMHPNVPTPEPGFYDDVNSKL